jgi:hypothetical protein
MPGVVGTVGDVVEGVDAAIEQHIEGDVEHRQPERERAIGGLGEEERAERNCQEAGVVPRFQQDEQGPHAARGAKPRPTGSTG